jgi:hypothetical protein
MQIKNYWVGDRPAGSWTFQVLNQRTGLPEDLTSYTSARVIFVDSDNGLIEFGSDNVAITSVTSGLVVFVWPQESLFNKPGRYAVQLELRGLRAIRKTTVQEILVREIGGVTK